MNTTAFVSSSIVPRFNSVLVRTAQPEVCSSAPLGVSSFLPAVRTPARMQTSRPAAPALISANVDLSKECDALAQKWQSEGTDPVEMLRTCFQKFPGEAAIAFSGAEDVALVEYASRTGEKFRVFALDTGRLHPETYRFFDKVEKHYGIRIEYVFPNKQEVEALVNEKGLFSFYEDGHQECCRARKVRPLRQKLSTLRAWVTGQRKDQSPGTRTEVPLCQLDPAFTGIADGPLIKYNPLANISSAEVWQMIRVVEVPYNQLHEQGYISIGCEPCTKPVLPNQHEREGRWWWEEATQKECGLHKGNISADAASIQAADDFVAKEIAASPIVLFSKSTCKFCKQTKETLEAAGFTNYKEFQVDKMEKGNDISGALERLTGINTVPNLFVAAKNIGTNEAVQKLNATGELKAMLERVAGVASR